MNHAIFRGQVVWITGASGGIGEALARRFADSGSRLVLSSRRGEELNRVARQCTAAESVAVIPLDLNRPELMDDAARRALDITRHIDVMVHNGRVSQRAIEADTEYSVDEHVI